MSVQLITTEERPLVEYLSTGESVLSDLLTTGQPISAKELIEDLEVIFGKDHALRELNSLPEGVYEIREVPGFKNTVVIFGEGREATIDWEPTRNPKLKVFMNCLETVEIPESPTPEPAAPVEKEMSAFRQILRKLAIY